MEETRTLFDSSVVGDGAAMARPGPAHLLEDGELPALVSGLEVVSSSEGWMEEGRHEARLVARKAVGSG